MKRILVESDTHCGALLGLTPPAWWRKDLEPIQSILWNWRQEQLAAIGPVDYHVLVGDLVDGYGKKDTIGQLTTDMDEQADMAEACVAQVQAGRRFFAYGTPFHVNDHGNAERRIARAFGCDISDSIRFAVYGTRFLFRHVVGRSDTTYGQGTQLAKEITRDLMQAILDDKDDADVHGRAHAHYFYEVAFKDKRAFINPCYQLPLEHHGATFPRTLRTQYYDVGCTVIDIDDFGEVHIRPRLMKLSEEYAGRWDYAELAED